MIILSLWGLAFLFPHALHDTGVLLSSRRDGLTVPTTHCDQHGGSLYLIIVKVVSVCYIFPLYHLLHNFFCYFFFFFILFDILSFIDSFLTILICISLSFLPICSLCSASHCFFFFFKWSNQKAGEEGAGEKRMQKTPQANSFLLLSSSSRIFWLHHK